MKALIDCDVLLYEIGFSSQRVEKDQFDENGEKLLVVNSWDFCQDLFDKKIELINEEVEADEPPLLFLTNTAYITKLLNKKRVREGKEAIEFMPVFRHSLAKSKPYKFGRAETKPFHYKNLISHALFNYDYYVNTHGLEADDSMCSFQCHASPNSTIICSRDKDLRQCPGWHYSWECGAQRSIGPHFVDPLGYLTAKNEKERKEAKKNGQKMPRLEVFGTGAKWLYYQMLAGDGVDNIGGLKKTGPVGAYNLLKDCKSERECFEKVRDMYSKTGEGWKERMRESADLVYMIRNFDFEKKEYERWRPPE